MDGILEFLWEATVQSALLFAALAVLRRALKGRLDPRLQYALWGLLLARLLLPFSLESPMSVLNAVEPATVAVREFARMPLTAAPEALPAAAQAPAGPVLGWPQALTALWLAGALATACCMAAANVRFLRRALRGARPLRAAREHTRVFHSLGIRAKLPLFVSDGVPSPCLVGLLRPKILLTPEAARMPERLRHILMHELCHWRHRDNWLALLRNAACAVHWFNPAVWAAARLSRLDCEMACDASALRSLGRDESLAYGETLIKLIRGRAGGNLLHAATTMAAGKKEMKERLNMIVRKPRTVAIAAAAALLASVTLAVAACTGAVESGTAGSTGAPTAPPAATQPAAATKPAEGDMSTATASPSPTSSQPPEPAASATAEPDADGVKLWEQSGWVYWLEYREGENVETRDGKSNPNRRLGRLYRTQGSERQVLEEFVDMAEGRWSVHPVGDRIVLLGFAGEKYTELKGFPSILSINADGTDRRIYAPKFNVARNLCADGGYVYYEGWTNDGAFPRPVNRMNADLTRSYKMADVDGAFITVNGGYAYYLHKNDGQIYRVRMDWKSRPEAYADCGIGLRFTVTQAGESEYELADVEQGVVYRLVIR